MSLIIDNPNLFSDNWLYICSPEWWRADCRHWVNCLAFVLAIADQAGTARQPQLAPALASPGDRQPIVFGVGGPV